VFNLSKIIKERRLDQENRRWANMAVFMSVLPGLVVSEPLLLEEVMPSCESPRTGDSAEGSAAQSGWGLED
jgi:hypothetical protein